MLDDKAIPRDIVIQVMRAHGVDVVEGTGDRPSVTFSREDGPPEVQFLPELVPKRAVMRLAHKFDVPPHFFWHPEKMPDDIRPAGLLPS